MKSKGSIVSGVLSATGQKFKFNKKIQCMNKPARVMKQSNTVTVDVPYVPEAPAPRTPLTEEKLEDLVLDRFKLHLKRACDDKVLAFDMTYHNLKHMPWEDYEREHIHKMLVVMKEEIDNG